MRRRSKKIKKTNCNKNMKPYVTLKLIKKLKDKDYNLYMVYKIKCDSLYPLYSETFTDEQYEDFFNKPSVSHIAIRT